MGLPKTRGLTADELASRPMRGASASVRGASGLVPAPLAGEQALFLRGDGTWAAASGGGGISALTGDVTASGTGSVAATIGNNKVTYAKMQAVSAAYRLLGVTTASGNVVEIAYTAFFLGLFAATDAAAFRTAIGAGTGSGSVTSVGLTLPADMTVASSPVTTSGTLTVTRVKPRWDVYEPPASAHAKDIEFTQGFSSDVAGTPTGLTDDDQGAVMTASSTKHGYTLLHDGTASRVAGGYLAPPTAGTNGVFTCYAHVSVAASRTTSGHFAVGLQIIDDVTALTTSALRGCYIMQRNGEGSYIHTTHSNYQSNPAAATTYDSFGSAIIRFIRDYVSGTYYWTYSLSLDGQSWFHFHQTTEQWSIGGIGIYTYTNGASAGVNFTAYSKFIRFLDVADYYGPCPGRWIT